MKTMVIKPNSGNIFSMCTALDKLGCSYRISENHEELRSADKVIFPGVGEASSTMKYLKERKLDLLIKDLKQPVLGVCLGMQLFCKRSEENDTECLGVIDAAVKKFTPSIDFKVPQMGWNKLKDVGDWLPKTVEGEYVYFVNSYYAPVTQFTSACAVHSTVFSAAMRKNNFYGVQFHPEKSGKVGEQILQSFLKL